MKTKWTICLMAALLLGCQANLDPAGTQTQASSQPSNSQPSDTGTNTNNDNQPLPGGAVQQEVDSPEAKAMRTNAENLLNQKYPEAGISLGEIYTFSTQVVAGTNFRLEVAYTDRAGASGRLKLTVFRDLDNQYELSEDDYSPSK